MNHKFFKPISIIVLVCFLWTFGGFCEIAYAFKNSPQSSGISQTKTQKPEEKFEKALEGVGEAIENKDVEKLKSEKAEIEKLDIEIRKQFRETEEKIKDLPDVIKHRHRDFVRKYEENLNTLRTDLEDIEKAKTKEDKEQAHKRAKEFLEKVKPPKKYRPLDPNKLPHRTPEEKQVVLEEYIPPPKRQIRPDLKKILGKDGGEGATPNSELRTQNSIQVASAGSLSGLLSSTVNVTKDIYDSEYGIQNLYVIYNSQNRN
jgi:hypothetical protein